MTGSEFGSAFRAKRTAAGITGYKVARRCGKSRTYIERIGRAFDELMREKATALLGAAAVAPAEVAR